MHGMPEIAPGRLLLVGAGGFLGSIARYWLGGVVQRFGGTAFPWGTLAVNVLGSFAIGVVLSLSLERGVVSPPLRLFLTVGVCGGFTTMSTFSYETFALVAEGSLGAAAGNVLGTLVLCFGAVWAGLAAGRML